VGDLDRLFAVGGHGGATVANLGEMDCWRQIDLSGFVANRLSAFWY
jgi:hypothetical protein